MLNFVVRLAFALAAIGYFVLYWAVVPYRDPEAELDLLVLSFFFGNQVPTGWARDTLLAARAVFGVGLALVIITPGLTAFFDFEAKWYAKFYAVVFGLLSIILLFASFAVHFFFNL